MTYFNTTGQSGQALLTFRRKAETQDDIIEQFFRAYPTKVFTPDEVLIGTGLNHKNVPLTSIRRSMTNLTRGGILEKTCLTKVGRYGRPSYCWRLKK